jgi:PAS domain S-box-containing protein/putative nucleotidyltransferase with HDIG domain
MERKTREENESLQKLEQEMKRLAVVLHDSSDAIIIQNMDGKIITWNHGAEKMYGYSIKEALGMNIGMITPPKKLAELHDYFHQLIAGEAVPSFETQRIAKDGSILDVWLTVTKIHEEPTDSIISTGQELGEPIGLALLERNITSRKQSETELKAEKELLFNIYKNLNEQIFYLDVETDGQFRLRSANPNYLKAGGFEAEEVIGKTVNEIIPEPYISLVLSKCRLAVEKREQVRWEDVVTYPDGITIIMDATLNPVIDGQGVCVGLVGALYDITERKAATEKISQALSDLKKSLWGTINVLSQISEMRDSYTAGHQRKVAELSTEIAKEMKLPGEQIETIKMAAIIHDIGKIAIPAEILTKPTKLSSIEYEMIKSHSQLGFIALEESGLPALIGLIVQQHHERQNGTGYPKGLKGAEIQIGARIIAVADVVDAMVSHRPYRSALGLTATRTELKDNRGILYDPMVVDACLAVIDRGGIISWIPEKK